MTTPDPAAEPDAAGGLLLSTLAGTLLDEFVEQFRGRGPERLTVQVDLARMHGGCNADALREIAGVAGVEEVRWLNRPGAAPVILDDAARAVLSTYLVRVSDPGLLGQAGEDGGSRPLIVLYQRDAKAVLVSARVGAGDEAASQRTLHLADLVDQATRHATEQAAEQAGGESAEIGLTAVLPEPEPALRCTECLRIVGAGEDPDALTECAGAECGAAQLRSAEPCRGELRPVMVLVAPYEREVR